MAPNREVFVTGCYVKGCLQPTRAFGDFALKTASLNVSLNPHEDEQVTEQPTKHTSKLPSKAEYIRAQNRTTALVPDADYSKGGYITASPELGIFEREPEKDELIVVGSDGLFDFLDPDEIASIARAAGNPTVAAAALTGMVRYRALQEAGVTERQYWEQICGTGYRGSRTKRSKKTGRWTSRSGSKHSDVLYDGEEYGAEDDSVKPDLLHLRREIHDDATVAVFYLQFPEAWRRKFEAVSEKLQKLCDEEIEQTLQHIEADYHDEYSAAADAINPDDENAIFREKRLEFSVCIADPSLEDSPLVAVSKGFENLTGYRVDDAIGRNCRFLSDGVPEALRDEPTTERLRTFTRVATSGDPFQFVRFSTPAPGWAQEIPGGGAYFCRWNRRKSGELFRNLFILRQIWIGDRTYIVALQTELPSDVDLDLIAGQQEILNRRNGGESDKNSRPKQRRREIVTSSNDEDMVRKAMQWTEHLKKINLLCDAVAIAVKRNLKDDLASALEPDSRATSNPALDAAIAKAKAKPPTRNNHELFKDYLR